MYLQKISDLLYIEGKTFPQDTPTEGFNLQATRIKIRIPLSAIEEGTQEEGVEYTVAQGLKKFKATRSADGILKEVNNLIGNVVYVPSFYIEKPIDDLEVMVWAETPEYFGTTILDFSRTNELYCLDPGVEALPPSMYDITTLPTIFKASSAMMQLQGSFVFERSNTTVL